MKENIFLWNFYATKRPTRMKFSNTVNHQILNKQKSQSLHLRALPQDGVFPNEGSQHDNSFRYPHMTHKEGPFLWKSL